MLDVTSTIRAEFRLDIYTEGFGKTIINVNKVFPSTISDVKGFTSSFMWCKARFKVRFNNIFNISKVTTLFSITIDRRHFTVKQLTDELRNYRSISTIRVLTAAKNAGTTLPYGTSLAKLAELGPAQKACAELEARATSVYGLAQRRINPADADYKAMIGMVK